MMEVYSRFLEIKGPFIAANGAVVANTMTHDMPYRNCVPGKDVIPVLEFCREQGFDHITASVDGCMYSRGSERIKKFEQYNEIAKKDGLPEIPLRLFGTGYAEVGDKEIYKVLISHLDTEQQRITKEFMRGFEKLNIDSSEPGLMDITASGVDKGTGVQNLARILGIEKKNICVFGDYWNDVPMFKAAGFSVAMGNGDQLVKDSATVVTGSNDEDGVASAIRKYILRD
jgi:Cof subfamily protein (haloacid dehalogenase superfamily)